MAKTAAISPSHGKLSLKQRRLRAGLSQMELAVRAGVSLTSVRLFERGYVPDESTALVQVRIVLDRVEAGVPLQDFPRFTNIQHVDPPSTDSDRPTRAA